MGKAAGKQINFRLSDDEHERVRRLAKREDRSMSSLARVALFRYLDELERDS